MAWTVSTLDIQSMEILKDASSTAIYGSRGSNSVITITTNGVVREARVTFDASVGLSTVRKQYDLLNAYEYATALADDIRGSSTISAEDLEAYKNGTKGINWTDLLTRTGITKDYRLAISGGNEKVKYLISGNVAIRKPSRSCPTINAMGFGPNIDSENAV